MSKSNLITADAAPKTYDSQAKYSKKDKVKDKE